MTFKLIRTLIILILSCIVAVKNEYCYMKDSNPYSYFATRTRYDIVRAERMFVPSDCRPFYIWALIRHGTRYAVPGRWHLDTLMQLQNQIITNHEVHKRGMLCGADLDALKKWDGNQYPSDMDGDLTIQGQKDALNLAKRLKATFPDLLQTSNEKYDFKTSSSLRARKTAIAFTNEFFQNFYTTAKENKITVDDDLLRINDKLKYIGVGEQYFAFSESKYIYQLLDNMSTRLGFQHSLSLGDVEAMYMCCSMETAWDPEKKSAFCAVFTTDELKMMEFVMDLLLYYKLGYGYPPVKSFYCPVVQDLISKLSDAVADSTMSELGSFRFTHSETIVPVVSKLGLYYDEPLNQDTYEMLKENRNWKASIFDPFLSNLMFVLYKCSSEYKVALYNNEHFIPFPGCDEKLCSFGTFQKNVKEKLTPEQCAIDSKYLITRQNQSKSGADKLHGYFCCWPVTLLDSLLSYISAFFVSVNCLILNIF